MPCDLWGAAKCQFLRLAEAVAAGI